MSEHGELTYGPNGGDVPLEPVSHGCVRIPYDIAQFFHTLVKTPGTPVYIYWPQTRWLTSATGGTSGSFVSLRSPVILEAWVRRLRAGWGEPGSA